MLFSAYYNIGNKSPKAYYTILYNREMYYNMKDSVKKVTKPVTDVGKELVNGVGNVGKEVVDSVSNIGKDAIKGVGGVVKETYKTGKNVGKAVTGNIKKK